MDLSVEHRARAVLLPRGRDNLERPVRRRFGDDADDAPGADVEREDAVGVIGRVFFLCHRFFFRVRCFFCVRGRFCGRSGVCMFFVHRFRCLVSIFRDRRRCVFRCRIVCIFRGREFRFARQPAFFAPHGVAPFLRRALLRLRLARPAAFFRGGFIFELCFERLVWGWHICISYRDSIICCRA